MASTTRDAPFAQGEPIASYVRDANALDATAFASKHGAFFLILQEGLSPTLATGRTLGPQDVTTGSMRVSVYAVRKKSDSKVRFVSIGRTIGNDVVLPERSISKFHAFFPTPHEPKLHDGGSHNGTFVNGVRVKGRGEGAPTELRDGDIIKMGTLTLTFVDAAGLQAFAQHWMP